MLSSRRVAQRLHCCSSRHAGLPRLMTTKVWYRPFHQAKARFTTIDTNGEPNTNTTAIRIGNPTEAYIYLEPEISNATKTAITRQLGGLGFTCAAVETLPLRFYHSSQHFAHESLLLPRIDIDQDLPRQQSTDDNISPATLWMSGNWHAITLDGSKDESFEKAARESAYELQGALEKLKDH